jgi:predicted amidohydrolase
MSSSIRVAAVQLRAHDRAAFATALDGIVESAREAAASADLVVMPEATLPAYLLRTPLLADEATVADALDRLRAIARENRSVMVIGAAVRDGASLRNRAVVIDADGSLAGHADKLFLWHFDRHWFSAGERIEPIETAVGKLGVLVCADGRLPTIARALVDRGAVALVMPTAWVTSGRDPGALENVQADLLARVRAYENAVPFVAANKCGSELDMVAYCGKSQIVDGRGELLAIASEREPQSVHAAISTAPQARPRRFALPTVAAREPLARGPLRLAISFDALPADIDERLALLDDAQALSPHDPQRLAALDREIGVVSAGDDLVLDPAGLVAYHRARYALVVWATELAAPWPERLARARALELRLYVVVFDRSQRRAFAVDPDGLVIAGTFARYRLASFPLDLRKTAEATVAPGSDVRVGLERIERILGEVQR